MPSGTLLYAQSGGVTAVINATASAVITEARRRKIKVLAARNGILGVLREDFLSTPPANPPPRSAPSPTPPAPPSAAAASN